MDRVDDPRLAFYLERRELIDEWAEIAKSEPGTAAGFLRTLESDVDRIADGIGDVRPGSGVLDGEEMLWLARPAWMPAGSDRPTALVAIAWYPRSVRFVSQWSAPWVGIRLRRSEPYAAATLPIREVIVDKSFGGDLFPTVAKGAWPRFAFLPAEEERYWDNLTPYRQALLDRLRAAFDTFAPAVDAVLR